MVTVKEIKEVEGKNGENYFGLIVQSGVIPLKSKSSGKIYFTAKTAFVPTTFDESTAKSLIGEQFDGTIKKVQTEAYNYTIQETGEVIKMTHRWEYVDETLNIVDDQVIESEMMEA